MGYVRSILTRQKSADLTYRHATGVHGNDLVIKARKTALMLGDQDRCEATIAVSGDIQTKRPIVGQNGLAAFAIALVGRRLRALCTLRVTKVVPSSAPKARSMSAFLNAMEASWMASALIGPLTNCSISSWGIEGNSLGVALADFFLVGINAPLAKCYAQTQNF